MLQLIRELCGKVSCGKGIFRVLLKQWIMYTFGTMFMRKVILLGYSFCDRMRDLPHTPVTSLFKYSPPRVQPQHLLRLHAGLDCFALQVLGNHDFDGGVSHVIEYLEKMNTSVVMTNVDVSKETRWPKNKNLFSDSLTLDVGGEKIGVCGYVLKSTPRYILDDLGFSFPKIPFYILQECNDSAML